jgi:hypothetical protein
MFGSLPMTSLVLFQKILVAYKKGFQVLVQQQEFKLIILIFTNVLMHTARMWVSWYAVIFITGEKIE